jgi:hypothetical protein
MFYGTLPEDTQDFRQVLAGIGRTIRDRAVAAGQRIGQSGQEAIALQNQAFADPRRPTRVTDEAALARLTDMIMGGPLGFAPAGITAYHGSPYLFRMFDRAKVGTGEGAQVYGVGAGYTAEARPVAEAYREALKLKDTDIVTHGEYLAKQALQASKMDKSKAIEMLKTGKLENTKVPEFAAKDVVESVHAKLANPEGFIYKGDIPDEILPKFLDWDKPLYEQSKEVKEALSKLPHRGNEWTFKDTIETLEAAPRLRSDRSLNPTGEDIYNMLGGSMMVGNRASGQLEATQKLDELGIRGIRYLDQKSRGNYKAQLIYKGEPYSDPISFMTKGQLDDYIKESKDKGFDVKTFPQTSNFVPFRPEDYKVQEINDIPLEDYISKGLL